MSVRPGSGRGRDASLPTAMASKPVSGRTGQQQAQAAPAGRGREQQQQQKSRCPSLGSRAVWPRRLGCPAPCQCACLPWTVGPLLFAISRLTHQCPTPTRRLLLCFVPFFLVYFKKNVFSVYPPPKLWHPLLSLASFSPFLSPLSLNLLFFSPSSSFVGFGRRSQESDLHVHRMLKQRRRRCGL